MLLAVVAFAFVGGVLAIAMAASFAAVAFVATQRAQTIVDSVAKLNLSRLTPETVQHNAPAICLDRARRRRRGNL